MHLKIGEETPRLEASHFSDLAELGLELRRRLAGRGEAPGELQIFRGERILARDLERVLSPGHLDLLEVCRIVNFDGEAFRSPFSAQIVEGLLIFSDPMVDSWRQLPYYVDPLWEAPHLARLLVRGSARSSLDVGCGSGVLSLIMALYSEEVIGVDVNPRAIVLSRLNAALNGVQNVVFEEDDLFAPVAGRRFDRIVFNSPTGEELEPKNSLEAGEEILARFFSEVNRFLAKSGYCQTNLGMFDRVESRFVDRLWDWLGADAATSQILLLLLRSKRPGWRHRLRDLVGSSPGGRVETWSRGWLTMRRGRGMLAVVPCNYREFPVSTPLEFGSSLIRWLFDSSVLLTPREDDRQRSATGAAPQDRSTSIGSVAKLDLLEMLSNQNPEDRQRLMNLLRSCLQQGVVEAPKIS